MKKNIAALLVFVFTMQIATPSFAQTKPEAETKALSKCADEVNQIIQNSFLKEFGKDTGTLYRGSSSTSKELLNLFLFAQPANDDDLEWKLFLRVTHAYAFIGFNIFVAGILNPTKPLSPAANQKITNIQKNIKGMIDKAEALEAKPFLNEKQMNAIQRLYSEAENNQFRLDDLSKRLTVDQVEYNVKMKRYGKAIKRFNRAWLGLDIAFLSLYGIAIYNRYWGINSGKDVASNNDPVTNEDIQNAPSDHARYTKLTSTDPSAQKIRQLAIARCEQFKKTNFPLMLHVLATTNENEINQAYQWIQNPDMYIETDLNIPNKD